MNITLAATLITIKSNHHPISIERGYIYFGYQQSTYCANNARVPDSGITPRRTGLSASEHAITAR